MKEYINRSFSIVTENLLKCKAENFKVFYENELNQSFEIGGYMINGDYTFVKMKEAGNFFRIKDNEKIYILRN
jgi:hypothetical protein